MQRGALYRAARCISQWRLIVDLSDRDAGLRSLETIWLFLDYISGGIDDPMRAAWGSKMIETRAVLASMAVAFAGLAGCGHSSNNQLPPAAAKPDMIVTFDATRHTCVVALYSEAQGSSVACGDVVPFARDELRLASGSSYETRADPGTDQSDIAKVESSLKDAGYRSIAAAQK